jgi:hypothetical protein
MNRWYCMDCKEAVRTDRHGRCGNCDSEAVILAESGNEVTNSASVSKAETASSLVCA